MSSFKLEQQVEGEKTAIILEGDLAGENVQLVKNYLASFPGKAGLILRLRDLQAISPAGMELLQSLADAGIALCGSGIYTEYIIKQLTSHKKTG